MSWNEILLQIVQTATGAIITLAIPFLFAMLRKQFKNNRLIYLVNTAERIVIDSVDMTSQRLVDTYKKHGRWNDEAMGAAFDACKENILALLNDEAKAAVITLHGDLDAWINTKLEANVRQSKSLPIKK